MKKKIFFIWLLAALVTISSWHKKSSIAAMDSGMDFDSMFKDFDFDFEKFSQELEQSMKKSEPAGEPGQPGQPHIQPGQPQVKKAAIEIPSDPETLFLNPPTEETNISGKKAIVPIKKARDNANKIVNDFIKEVRNLEHKISTFSEEVQDMYKVKYRKLFDEIEIAAEMLTSKKIYQIQLLETTGATDVKKEFIPKAKEGGNLSPQNAQSLRQNIIAARKKARELNARIKEEKLIEQKEKTEKEKLEKFVEPKKDLPKIEKIGPSKKSKRRGSSIEQSKKQPPSKKLKITKGIEV